MQNLLSLLPLLACPLCMVVMGVMMGKMMGGRTHNAASPSPQPIRDPSQQPIGQERAPAAWLGSSVMLASTAAGVRAPADIVLRKCCPVGAGIVPAPMEAVPPTITAHTE